MKKLFLLSTSAISLIVLSFIILGINSFTAIAQTQDISPTVTTGISQTQDASPPVSIESPEQTTETPILTPEPTSLEVRKEYQIVSDRNANGSIDPGDKIRYTINLKNNGSTEGINLLIRDKIPGLYFVNIPEEISKGGNFNGEFIEWTLDQLAAGSTESFNYTVTLKDPLDSGVTDILNSVTVLSGETQLAEAISKFSVVVPTPTPTPVLTPTLSITPGTPTSTPASTGAPVLNESLPSMIMIGILALVCIGVFSVVGGIDKLLIPNTKEEKDEITLTKVTIFREGVIIIFIVTAVLFLGLARSLPSDAVISILSAIVGYVFGRVTSNK